MAENLAHDDDMLTIPEGLAGSLWADDDSWAFPILTAPENSGGQTKGKEVEMSPATKGKKRRAAEAGGSADHEQHIIIERERRKKMRDMFTSLHSLIPNLPQRTDKATVVDEAIQYIAKLQKNLGNLQRQKAVAFKGNTSLTAPAPTMLPPNNNFSIQSREAFLSEYGSKVPVASNTNRVPIFPTMFKTWTSPNVILNVFGKDAHINICTTGRPGLLSGICNVLENYVLEAVSAEVSSEGGRCMLMIHVRANGGGLQFPGGSYFLVEETFKQAAAEIMVFVQNQQCF